MQICYTNSRHPCNVKMYNSLEITLGLRNLNYYTLKILNQTILKTTKYIYQNHEIIAFIIKSII